MTTVLTPPQSRKAGTHLAELLAVKIHQGAPLDHVATDARRISMLLTGGSRRVYREGLRANGMTKEQIDLAVVRVVGF